MVIQWTLVMKIINEDGSFHQTIMNPNGERRYNQKWSEQAELVYGHSVKFIS